MTQERLSELSRCDVKTVRNAEADRNLDITTLQRIASALKVDLSFVVDSTPDPSEAVREHSQIVKRWLEAVNQQNVDVALSCYDDESVVSYPSSVAFPGSGDFSGIEAIRNHYQSLYAFLEFDLAQMGTIAIQPGSDRVFFRGTISGRIRTSNRFLSSEMVHEFQIQRGVFIHHLCLFDTAAFAEAMK